MPQWKREREQQNSESNSVQTDRRPANPGVVPDGDTRGLATPGRGSKGAARPRPQPMAPNRTIQSSPSPSTPSIRPPPRRPIVTSEELASVRDSQVRGPVHASEQNQASVAHVQMQAPSLPPTLRVPLSPPKLVLDKRSPSTGASSRSGHGRAEAEARDSNGHRNSWAAGTGKRGRGATRAGRGGSGVAWGQDRAEVSSLAGFEQLLDDESVPTSALLAALPKVSLSVRLSLSPPLLPPNLHILLSLSLSIYSLVSFGSFSYRSADSCTGAGGQLTEAYRHALGQAEAAATTGVALPGGSFSDADSEELSESIAEDDGGSAEEGVGAARVMRVRANKRSASVAVSALSILRRRFCPCPRPTPALMLPLYVFSQYFAWAEGRRLGDWVSRHR